MISKFLGCFVFAVFAFGANQGFAIDTTSDSPNTQDASVIKAIQGNAHFEQHHTIIPLVCTRDQGCAKSQPYWTLVVNSAGVDYEVDAQFDLGRATAPTAVTVLGVTVPAGAVVSLEGAVEYSGDHYVLLNELRNIGVVRSSSSEMTDEFSAENLVEPASQPIIANFMNWNCRGQLDGKTELLAQIWFAGSETDQENRYRVRVSGSQVQGSSRQLFNIGTVDDAHVSRGTEQLVYDGKNSEASFRVSIQNSGVTRDVPGTLYLSVVKSVFNQNLPIEEQVNLLCNRTR